MLTIRENVPLAPFTSFNIGGPARYFTEAATVNALREAFLFTRERELPHLVLGGGTNLLISDNGFPGLIIKAGLNAVVPGSGSVEAEAGVDLMRLVLCAQTLGLSGLESLAGIPGTVGGAVRGNAGAYGGTIADRLESVLALELGTLETVRLSREECRFGYRSSRFKEGAGLVVLSARLSLTPAPRSAIAEKVQETVAKRLAKNLDASRCVGSYFMNPLVHDPALIAAFERERGVRCRECRIPAGWFIDSAGLRSTRVGGAMVSEQHANYIINTGDATAADVLRLAQLVKDRVRTETGVELQEEVSRVGF